MNDEDRRTAEKVWHDALHVTSYADSVAVIAEALAEVRADTRATVLRDAADALRQADLATADERREEGWR